MGHALIESPLGPLGLTWVGETLTGVDLEPEPSIGATANDPPPGLVAQIQRYFADGRAPFDLSIQAGGTAFQRRVWDLMQAIPAGETRTYGDIARDLDSAPRAVGQACRANPVPIVVPCHRVVAASGLGGFAGDSSGHRLGVKRWLLCHEGVDVLA